MSIGVRTNRSLSALRASGAAGALARVLLLTGILLVVIVSAAIGRFGSIRAAVGFYLRDEVLLAEPTVKSFGTIASGEVANVRFAVTNLGNLPIRIVGCQVPCTCMAPDPLPLVVPARRSRELSFSVKTTTPQGGPIWRGPVHLAVTLFTSHPPQLRVPLVIQGVVAVESGLK
jgi:hypothetical protein